MLLLLCCLFFFPLPFAASPPRSGKAHPQPPRSPQAMKDQNTTSQSLRDVTGKALPGRARESVGGVASRRLSQEFPFVFVWVGWVGVIFRWWEASLPVIEGEERRRPRPNRPCVGQMH